MLYNISQEFRGRNVSSSLLRTYILSQEIRQNHDPGHKEAADELREKLSNGELVVLLEGMIGDTGSTFAVDLYSPNDPRWNKSDGLRNNRKP